MANAPKPTNRAFWLLFGGLALIAVLWVYTDEEPTTSRSFKPVPKSSKKAKANEFLPEDYKARFAVLNKPAKNAFRPLVVKAGSGGSNGLTGLPPAYTDGEGNWVYSGSVEIDGTPNALIENTQTGEGVFLKTGEKWKSTVVKSIGQDALVIDGPAGVVSLKLGQTGKDPGSLPPVNPGSALVGPIGPMAIQPLPGAVASNPNDPNFRAFASDPNAVDTRSGRRGRRGGNGGYFGP